MDRTKNGKLNVASKLTYSIGQISDSVGFNVFYFFFLFFLTDFAGVKPSIAGTISLVAILWDAVSDPIIGYITDNLKSKYGRRRPMMLAGVIPYGICTFLLFNNMDLGENAKIFYFLALAMLFWTAYTSYVIPFGALGAELTDDFNERTSLRAWASVFIYLSVMLASATPPIIIGKVMEAGYSSDTAWNIVGALFGLVIIIAGLICWNFTRGGEIKRKIEKREDKGNILKNYIAVIKLKPTKFLIFAVLALAFSSTIVSSGVVYLMANVLRFSPERQSTTLVILTIVSILWLPVINFLSRKFDKRIALCISVTISFITWFIFAAVGIESFGMLLMYIIFGQIGVSAYWTLYFSMMYDISELDEFISGRRREGSITALMSFFQKLGAAIATWLMGQLLTYGGYDAALEVQSDAANHMILFINTLVPAIFGVLALVFILMYPLTGKKFTSLMAALSAKRDGRAYTTDGFEKLI